MTDKAIEAIRKEIVALTAENLAMQFVLTSSGSVKGIPR
jgi:hypothetical protein